jgi:hypothetical protein
LDASGGYLHCHATPQCATKSVTTVHFLAYIASSLLADPWV